MSARQTPIDKLADAFGHIATPMQIAKMVEEVGEAAGAYIGVIGANPRKGETHTMQMFRTELLDVALTALMLYRNTAGGPPIEALCQHITERWERHEREVGTVSGVFRTDTGQPIVGTSEEQCTRQDEHEGHHWMRASEGQGGPVRWCHGLTRR